MGKDEGYKKFYITKEQGIEAVLTDLATVKHYPIKGFYKPELVAKALKDVEIAPYKEYETAQGTILKIDTQALKDDLIKHIDKVVAFYSLYEQSILAEIISRVLPKEAIEKLGEYFTPEKVDLNSGQVEMHNRYYDNMPTDSITKLANGSKIIDAFVITDEQALKDKIKTLKPKLWRSFEIIGTADGYSSWSFFVEQTQRTAKLAKDCGIKPSEGRLFGVGDVSFGTTELVINQIMTQTLANMRTRRASTRYTNIKGDEVGIPKEIIDAGDEGIIRVKENPQLLSSLDVVYRNEQERAEQGGLAVQTELFKGLLAGNDITPTDLAPWRTIDEAIRALNIAGTNALVTCARYLHEQPNGGDISIDELMQYNHKYREQKSKEGYLAKTDKKAFSNSLKLLLSLNWAIKERRNDRLSTIKYYRLINGEIDIDNATGEIVSIRKLRFDKDFYDIQNKLIYVIAPKGIDYLTSPEAKSVALRVQSRFVNNQAKTIKGEPITVTRDWLAKGSYKINSRTNELLKKLLDDFVEQGIIAKWHTKNGKHALNGYDKNTYTLLLYPTEQMQESYITKEMRATEKRAKQEANKNNLQTIKRVIRSYGDNEALAKELGVTTEQLELWQNKAEPVPKSVADKAGKLL